MTEVEAIEVDCPLAQAIRVVGDTWTLLIVRALISGKKRFCELEKIVPEVNTRTLTERLKRMVDEGIIDRHQFMEIPPRVEYSLTEKGKSLKNIINEIEIYANQYFK